MQAAGLCLEGLVRVSVKEPKVIRVSDDTGVGALLDEAQCGPLIIERGKERYRLEPAKQDIWAGYDPERVRAAIDVTAGSWADVDTEKLIADLRRWREEGSRPLA